LISAIGASVGAERQFIFIKVYSPKNSVRLEGFQIYSDEAMLPSSGKTWPLRTFAANTSSARSPAAAKKHRADEYPVEDNFALFESLHRTHENKERLRVVENGSRSAWRRCLYISHRTTVEGTRPF
jgi:hypothetical protein